MFQLSVTPRANSDLTGIWLYPCEEWGAEQADKYLDQLAAGMKQLMSHPSLGTNYAHVLPGYRTRQAVHILRANVRRSSQEQSAGYMLRQVTHNR
ncbi:type II toxin-antitoxin system RelE/ParE family toxin [Aliidiomarina minuta]|uniref:Type II toxin-antitoxin system RelE/ParE family toxin n=1 Tax=Aliidiomarina minuta TaxID=880057 RepID=A0A432W637_9GAMM|nr:type II toxin-antitoxin system RelE/ParE family toxin [Aliidiomarina minuta]